MDELFKLLFLVQGNPVYMIAVNFFALRFLMICCIRSAERTYFSNSRLKVDATLVLLEMNSPFISRESGIILI
jgi:hypothetical protein